MFETLFGGAFLFLWCGFGIAVIIGWWRVFEKAGHPGWACLIPFYNMYILTEIADLEIYWFLLLFVPGINIVASVWISLRIAEAFGIGLAFLGCIFYPILGFGPAQYGAAAGPPPPTGYPPTQYPPSGYPPQPTQYR